MTFRHRLLLRALGVLTAVLALAAPAAAQSLTTGALHGTVRDPAGVPLAGARITVTGTGTGVSRVAEASRDGRFELAFLPPGTYDLVAERLGHRPRRVEGIPVAAGRRLTVDVALAASAPPVDRIDVERFDAAAANSSPDFSGFEVDGLPSLERDLGDLVRLSTRAAADLGTEGLPASLTGVVVDGLSLEVARHPTLARDPVRTAAVPLGSVGRAGLMPGAVDVEWPRSAGGRLVAFTRQGGRDFTMRGYGDWSGDALAGSDYYPVASHSSLQGGFVASGPLIRDTAHFVVGVEGRRLETPFPRVWELASIAAAGRAVARDSFGVELSQLEQPRVARTEVVSAFTRLDWRVADGHALSVRANLAAVPTVGVEPASFGTSNPGGHVDGRDIAVAATLTSLLGSRVSQEIRLGFTRSLRNFVTEDGSTPFTGLVAGGLTLGADPALPAKFERTAFEAVQSVHYAVGVHRLKGGLALDYTAFDDSYATGRSGRFLFGGTDHFARHEGLFLGTDGGSTAASFSVPRFAAFVQDTWSAVPGLDVTVGIRYELENLPTDELRLDEEWLRLTGIASQDVQPNVQRVSPRIGLNWDVRERHRWFIHAAAGIFHDRVDPAVLSELLTSDGRPIARRALGDLGDWPTPSFAAAALDTGSVLALLGPDFAAPRTARASLGVSRGFGSGTSISVSAALRRTDFLPRRADLNLSPAAVTEDQYGRPVYGSLVRQGGLLTAEPGSNRRFDAYDRVYAINADGRSDYWGVTVGLDHETDGPVTFFGRYTYSATRDNWLSGRGGAPDDALDPFPADVEGENWAEGRSDFDVPHRAAVGAEWRLPVRSGLRITGVYRYRSGGPFTPGFRDGVDANGDGALGNDPAFVDDQIEGVAELIGAWDCLREQVGRFAERNACRMPGVHALDLRLGIELPRIGGLATELVVDGFNLVESDVGVPDRALYLVDETQPLAVDPATGRITVPLVANPHFGKLLQRWSSGRTIRLGLRVGY